MNKDYSATLLVDQTPKEAYDAINDVRAWWTENLEGNTEQLNDEFTVYFGEVHVSTQRLVEVVPNKKMVWLVTMSKLNFTKKEDEWTGTKIVFDIAEKNGKTQVVFTHMGLVPEYECYNACSNAWSEYLQGSLLKLITTGKGEPTPKEVDAN